MTPICHNAELDAILSAIVTRWNTSPEAMLRLFRNDFEPDPDSVLDDFMEANWTGYAAVSLLGELSAAAKLSLGWWQSQSGLYEYQPPVTNPGNVVYGLYVTQSGTVRASLRFDAPITMSPGSLPFRVRLKVNCKSESVFLSS